MIKAIETEYNGCLFRSRLEARWAVFFDALGVEYQYELEGFDLGEAGWYLPDFYLPGLKLWVEIKAESPTDEERLKACVLAHDLWTNVLIIYGVPWVKWSAENWHEYAVVGFFGDGPSTRQMGFWLKFYYERFESLREFLVDRWSEGYDWVFRNFCEFIPVWDGKEKTIRELIELDREYYWARYGKEHPVWKYGYSEDGLLWAVRDEKLFLEKSYDKSGEFFEKHLMIAYKAARQARFEHRNG